MRKIGRVPSFFAVLLFLLSSGTVQAQQVQVSAELSETNIYSGETVRFNITVSGQSIDTVEEPEIPAIEGLRWLRGSSSHGSSYSLINGRPSVSYTFGFQFIAQDAGTYTFPSITVNVNGTEYQTKSIRFKVLDPAAINNAERSPDIYLRLETNTSAPVVGQQIVAEVILYFKNDVEVSSYQSTPGWKAEGFWKEELQNPQRAQTTSTIINGVRYQRARLLQYALFPTKAGELTISPYEVTVSVRRQRTARDPFGFGLNQERMELRSPAVTMQVKQLPDLQNAQFLGAVGHFNIKREISTSNALVGESIEVETTISGTGNIPLINKPEYEYPESLEKYNPQENTEIYRENRVISGTKTFTDILIARNEGSIHIPEERLAFYNPTDGQYERVILPSIDLYIERDPNAITANREQLRLNISPITGLATWQSASYKPLHARSLVWILIIVPFVFTGLALVYKSYIHKLATDTAFARNQKAGKKADITLSEAEKSKDVKEGYHLIEKALHQYITDKYNLPPAGLNAESLLTAIEKDTSAPVQDETAKMLRKCETIAYAPQVTQQGLDADIKKTRDLIKGIGKQK